MYSAESKPLLSLPHLKLHSCLKRVKALILHYISEEAKRSGFLQPEDEKLRGHPTAVPSSCTAERSSSSSACPCSPGRGKSQTPESLSVTEEKGGAAGEDSSHRYGVGMAAARSWGNGARRS